MINEIITDHSVEGQRIDKAMSVFWPFLSRSKIQKYIESGYVSLDGAVITKTNIKLKAAQVLRFQLPDVDENITQSGGVDNAANYVVGQTIHVVYEDDSIIVLDKPAGICVHPVNPISCANAAWFNNTNTLVHSVASYLGGTDRLSSIGFDNGRPGVLHRLDKDTSGLILFAKTDEAHEALASQLNDRIMCRVYTAVIYGVPHHVHSTITTYVKPYSGKRGRMMVCSSEEGGKIAITHCSVLCNDPSKTVSVVSCRLETGRTHQIRLHLTHKKHPLVGDQMYGRSYNHNLDAVSIEVRNAMQNMRRQALHATMLRFVHPDTMAEIELNSRPAQDIAELIELIQN